MKRLLRQIRPAFAYSLLVVSVSLARAVELGAPTDTHHIEEYPQADSKKGLLVEETSDALRLGIQHATVNVNLSQLVDPDSSGADPAQPHWICDGKTYYFHQEALSDIDRRIKPLSDAGVHVYLILLVYESGDAAIDRILLHPRYDSNAPNHLSAFNCVTEEGRDWLAATLEFLAERWSRPDLKFGRAVGYIVGNEVNSHWWWSNQGRCSMAEFADNYLAALRLTYDAVSRQSSGARVYLSLEHHWNIRYPAGDGRQAFPAREFLDWLVDRSQPGEVGDFPWNVAFHPYPEDLFDPRFWLDESASNDPDTPRITFKNLEVLTEYLLRPELLFRGQTRRIILSEQGFHSGGTTEGEQLQAAAYCYAYRKVAALEGIDAFIYHRHIDHPDEGGLLLGLRRRNADGSTGPPKPIYECFRAANTQDWQPAFEFALPIVGLSEWEQHH